MWCECCCDAGGASVSNIYIAELLPTSCRSSVMGICSQASRVGSITAPFLLMMGTQVAMAGRSQVGKPGHKRAWSIMRSVLAARAQLGLSCLAVLR